MIKRVRMCSGLDFGLINGMLQIMRKKKEFGMNQKRILKGMQREYIESGGINIRNHRVVMDNTEVECHWMQVLKMEKNLMW